MVLDGATEKFESRPTAGFKLGNADMTISEMLPETAACTSTARPKTTSVMMMTAFLVTIAPGRPRALLADTDTILVLLYFL
ncbi:MAG: hypothetical protein ABJ059_10040 [Hyphomicrobiales bacterium]